MASKTSWFFLLMLVAQYPASCVAQPAVAGAAAPASPLIIVVKPGQTAVAAVSDAMRAREFTRYPAAEAAMLLHPTTEAQDAGSGYPRVSAGKIMSPTLNVQIAPGLAPSIEISYHAPAGFAYAIATFTSPHGQTLVSPYSYLSPKITTRGSVTFQAPPSPGYRLYAEPGAWALTSLEIVDQKYQKTIYSAKKLAKLFPGTTINVINNGTPDFTPPTISAGAILTHRVNLYNPNAVFRASLTAADDVSGVATPIILVNMEKSAQNAVEFADTQPLASNSGTFDITVLATRFGPFPGVWYVVGYGAMDVAGNLFLEERPREVKATFGRVKFLLGSF